MAWDTERTRRLLLEAATAEFSAHGPDGARVDRIATQAGVNKERIYQYFGSKDALFDAVIAHELGEVTADVPIVGSGPDAIGEYAAALLERIVARPELGRLIAWEGLVRGTEIEGRDERWRHCRDKIAAVQAALPGVDDRQAGHLLLTIVTLTDGWRVFPQLGAMFVGDGARPEAQEERRRELRAVAVVLAERAVADAAAASAASGS
ncbi:MULTISPECIES: TetR/AcrR family transcriptional regulator [unclassified Microbacterium]|uniref:TetR/AcrR family transcriptional regulator n=1 Tax=unclassified Microbacterium TaxID=2609290 RepID=UPI0030159B2D